jgi:hypothetical protein
MRFTIWNNTNNKIINHNILKEHMNINSSLNVYKGGWSAPLARARAQVSVPFASCASVFGATKSDLARGTIRGHVCWWGPGPCLKWKKRPRRLDLSWKKQSSNEHICDENQPWWLIIPLCSFPRVFPLVHFFLFSSKYFPLCKFPN